MLGTWPEDHSTSNAVESDGCNSSPHIRTDFAFPWQYLIIVSHFAVAVNPLNAELNPICHLLALLGGATVVVVSRLKVKQNGSTGKCVEESKDRDSPQCYLTMTSPMLYPTRTMFTAWCDRSLYIIHVTSGCSFKLALVMIHFRFINVLK
jgi:hypothetical protein